MILIYTKPTRRLRVGIVFVLFLVLLGSTNSAAAQPTIFFGEDLGLDEYTRLTSHPNADSARANFLAQLSNPGTEDFESFDDNKAAPIAVDFGRAGTATLQGNGEIEEILTGTNKRGRYPISGDKYWESSRNFYIEFTDPQVAFGFYGVDIGDFRGQLTVTYEDGSAETILIPHTTDSFGGTVIYFGFIDLDNPFINATFGHTGAEEDIFGFDDFTIGTKEQVVPTPKRPSGGQAAAAAIAIAAIMIFIYILKKQPRREPVKEKKKPEPDEEEKQQYGSLSASSDPDGAVVLLDGAYQGTSAMNIDDILIGPHIVVFAKFGYFACKREVVVNADQKTLVHCDLTEIPELKLKLVAEPSKINADGKSESKIKIWIEDNNENKVPVPEDVTVELETNKGKIESPVKILAGHASVTATLTSPTDKGTAMVKAKAEFLKGSTTAEFAGVKKEEGKKKIRNTKIELSSKEITGIIIAVAGLLLLLYSYMAANHFVSGGLMIDERLGIRIIFLICMIGIGGYLMEKGASLTENPRIIGIILTPIGLFMLCFSFIIANRFVNGEFMFDEALIFFIEIIFFICMIGIGSYLTGKGVSLTAYPKITGLILIPIGAFMLLFSFITATGFVSGDFIADETFIIRIIYFICMIGIGSYLTGRGASEISKKYAPKI
jgi:hypothetical protein